jgi:hypothetical protein
MWILALVSIAWLCAGLVHDQTTHVESDAQEVLFTPSEGAVTVSYRVTYAGDSADFGWIIPIAGEFLDLQEGDEASFDDLRRRTGPLVTYHYDDEGSAGCTCGGSKSGDSLQGRSNGGDSGTLEVVAEGYTGTYSYQVVAASDAADLASWLDANGWSLSSEEPVSWYVDRGYPFVLVSILPEVAVTPEGGRVLPPVAISYSGDALVFPAVMGRYAMVEEQRTTVYVAGGDRASVSGWIASDLAPMIGDVQDDPTALFEEALWAAGGSAPGYAVTFAGPIDDAYVTRFDTRAAAAAHVDDATFRVGTGSVGDVRAQIDLYQTPPYAAALLPGLGLAVWFGRRRSRA